MVAAMWPSSDRASPQPPAGRAVPSLGPFAELLGQPYQRLKVAVLRQLAGLPEPSWSLAEAGQALTWLEPATANRLLSELRTDGLVVEADRYGQPGRPPAWRLSDEGHLVAAVCAVLAAPAIPPERSVKVLAAAMALARAAGVEDRAAFAPFVAATAVLERDLAALHRLIDQGDDDRLAGAAEVAAVHLADLAEMARQVARPGGHEPEREHAAAVAGRLRSLLDELAAGPEAAPAEPAGSPADLVAAAGPGALAGLGESDLARWVVGGTWAEASARMAAVVEAWSRWGPAGDGSLAAELDPQPRLEVVGHDEVGIVSWTGVRARGVELAARRPVEIDLTDDPAPRSTGGLGMSPPDPADPRQEVAT